MPTIQELKDVIKKHDGAPGIFYGLSYHITHNESLSLPDGSRFLTVSPFGHLPKPEDYKKAVGGYAEGKMPIQDTFKQVLIQGYALCKDQATLIIDISDLDDDLGNTVFLTEGGKSSVAHAIADLVEQVPHDFTPVIRFLRGTHQPQFKIEEFWKTRQPGIEAIFWRKEGNQLIPLITHPKAEFHIGYYSPNMILT
jgi:hypothetical protein